MVSINAKASQDFVQIKEIRDGIVIMRDGGLRAVLMASSVNFALKSEDEQIAIIEQFQNFLNSLDFSLQIVAESRRFDVKPYLALLAEKERGQKNELLKIQTREYINFIKKFTDNTNIMNKLFFAVVPYTPAIMRVTQGGEGVLGAITGGLGLKKSGGGDAAAQTQSFEENYSQLEQRISIVEQGLMRCGIRVAELGTEEVVELLYKLFNPGETEHPVMG